jgi:putative peptide zinc metalloprotease protein
MNGMNDSNQPDWTQIAELIPRLHRHIHLYPQDYRGARWYVLHNDANDNPMRFNETAYAFIGRIDGELTVQENLESIQKESGDGVLTPQEIVMILAQLLAAGALGGGISAGMKEYLGRFQSSQRGRKKFNPLVLRIPLFDPDELLNLLVVFMRPLFSRGAMVVWLLFVGIATLLTVVNFSSLVAAFNQDLLRPENLFLLVVLYGGIKIVHEFAHAIAIKIWGGEVHEMGLTLLVLAPVPHVDATSSWTFRDKYKRVLVSAAGIMAELFVAAVALFVWLTVEPGTVKDTAFNVVLIASVSTVMFNANPLLRFDGYYMLQDFIEIPNLATRSSRYYIYLIQRYLFGLEDARSPQTADGEPIWFAVYGPAALIYRLIVMIAIGIFLINEYLIIGVVLACWAISAQLLLPIARGLLFVFLGPQLAATRARATGITVSVVTVLVVVLGFVPVSLTTRADGVVWVPDQAQMFAKTEGFVERLFVSSGDHVEVGDVLVEMRNPVLLARIAVLKAQRREMLARSRSEYFKERVKSQNSRTELETIESELELIQEEAAGLVIRSQVSGTVVLLAENGLNGMYLRQGQLLGYVSKQDRLIIRSVVTQSDIGLLRRNVSGVEVRLAENLSETIKAKIIRETPAASLELPSAALGTLGGGKIAVNSLTGEANARKAITKVFQVDLELNKGVVVTGLGERAYIIFDHGSEPIAMQWLRVARQLVLSQLSA